MGIDIAFADKDHAFVDDKPRCLDVSKELGRGAQFDLVCGNNIAINLALQDQVARDFLQFQASSTVLVAHGRTVQFVPDLLFIDVLIDGMFRPGAGNP